MIPKLERRSVPLNRFGLVHYLVEMVLLGDAADLSGQT